MSLVRRTLPPLLWLAHAVLWCASSAAAGVTLDEARELHRSGQYEQALSAYRAVLASDAPAADRATAANNACVIQLDTGRYADALAHCEQARDLRVASGDSRRLARTQNNLGAVREAMGDYRGARAAYTEALRINLDREDAQSIVINYANLGVLETQIGNYGPALRHYRRAAELATSHSDSDWAQDQLVLAQINRGVVLERIGAYADALEAYRAVRDAITSLPVTQQASFRVNLGVVYRNLGDPVRALAEFDQADALFESISDPAGRAGVWLDRGLVYQFNLADSDRAQASYERADELARAAGAVYEQMQALYYLGRVSVERGQLAMGRDHYDEVLAIARDNGSVEGQWSAYEGRARVAMLEQDVATAAGHVETALALVESTRAGIGQLGTRQSFFGGVRKIYALGVEIAWQRWEATRDRRFVEQGFDIVQRAKSRDLLGMLLQADEPIRAGELDELLAIPLLEYFFGDEYLYAWLADGKNLRMQRLIRRADAAALATATYDGLRGAGAAPPLADLSEALVIPFAADLAGAERVMIAPDGLLFYVPFETLQYANGSILLDAHLLSYVPSASVAAGLLSQRSRVRTWRLAAFGAPAASTAMPGLPLLAAANEELERLQQRIAGEQQVFLGSAATEARAMDTLRAGATIAHFATHTVLDDRRGPAIVLAEDVAADGLWFPAEITAAAPLPIGLTVLAACRSGLGQIEDGRAVSSLTGALLAAGSESILATLWDIDDAYTAVFMREFYDELQKGRAPAHALKRTKQRMRANEPESKRWAAYVLVGKSGPLLEAPAPRIGWLAGGLVLLAAFLWLSRARVRG